MPEPKELAGKLETFQAFLAIDKNKLDDELEAFPELYHRVADAYALCLSLRDEAKLMLDKVTAETDEDVRAEAARSDQKMTEAKIAHVVRLDEVVRDALGEHNHFIHLCNRWLALRQAFEQRGYALKELAALYVAGYFGGSVVVRERAGAVERRAEEGRAGMQRARLARRGREA